MVVSSNDIKPKSPTLTDIHLSIEEIGTIKRIQAGRTPQENESKYVQITGSGVSWSGDKAKAQQQSLPLHSRHLDARATRDIHSQEVGFWGARSLYENSMEHSNTLKLRALEQHLQRLTIWNQS